MNGISKFVQGVELKSHYGGTAFIVMHLSLDSSVRKGKDPATAREANMSLDHLCKFTLISTLLGVNHSHGLEAFFLKFKQT